MQELTDSSSLLGDADALRERLGRDGYLLVRDLLEPPRIGDVRRQVFDVLGRAGWLDEDATLEVPSPSPLAVREGAEGYLDAYVGIQKLQDFHELAHDPAVIGLITGLIDEQLLVHPRKIARTSLPHDDEYTPPHQDYRLIQGSVDSLTVWVPLGDCPAALGSLRVLQGSHRDGLRPATATAGVGGMSIGVRDDDPAWRVADYRAGDVIVFTSLTVHGALRNNRDVLRLSADFRYQPLADPVNPDSLLPHYHPHVPDWHALTSDWSSQAAVAVDPRVRTQPALPPLDPALVAPPSRKLALH